VLMLLNCSRRSKPSQALGKRRCKYNVGGNSSLLKEFLGVSREGVSNLIGSWWWNDKVKQKVKKRQEAFLTIGGSSSDEGKSLTKLNIKGAKTK